MDGDDETMTTVDLKLVEDLVDFILWDTPTSLFPTAARVRAMIGELQARPDVESPIVQDAIAECRRFLEPWPPTDTAGPDTSA